MSKTKNYSRILVALAISMSTLPIAYGLTVDNGPTPTTDLPINTDINQLGNIGSILCSGLDVSELALCLGQTEETLLLAPLTPAPTPIPPVDNSGSGGSSGSSTGSTSTGSESSSNSIVSIPTTTTTVVPTLTLPPTTLTSTPTPTVSTPTTTEVTNNTAINSTADTPTSTAVTLTQQSEPTKKNVAFVAKAKKVHVSTTSEPAVVMPSVSADINNNSQVNITLDQLLDVLEARDSAQANVLNAETSSPAKTTTDTTVLTVFLIALMLIQSSSIGAYFILPKLAKAKQK